MRKIMLALAAGAAMFMTGPVSGSVAKADPGLRMAQVDIGIGRDRDRDYDRGYRDRDVTVGVGPGGITVGPRRHCRTVTTWIERDDGRRVKRTERRCD
jgi:hypothetical protein